MFRWLKKAFGQGTIRIEGVGHMPGEESTPFSGTTDYVGNAGTLNEQLFLGRACSELRVRTGYVVEKIRIDSICGTSVNPAPIKGNWFVP